MTESSRRRHVTTIIAALAGLALFTYAVRRAGLDEILDGVRRVGWGLLLILAIGGLRYMLRAECWRLCLPPGARLGYWQALVAFIAGDAVGTVTPLGLIASEPTKIFLTRHHLATRESVASLALENILYSASVVAMVAIGLVTLLLTVPLPASTRTGAFAALAVLGVVTLGGTGVLVGAARRGEQSGRGGWMGKAASVIAEVQRFSAANQGRLWRAFVLDLAYHALAVLEVFITLEWLLGSASPTLVQAIVFEALNRVVTVVFKFVPFRVGVDEALTGALAPLLAVDPASGVALAVIRKVRNLFWTAVGLAAIVRHPARQRRA